MKIYADQAIYGYADGHRLLASSARHPAEVERRLLIASDVSPVSDIQRSLRAIPLPELNRWALCATWAAPEMSRPGSVWSHILILDVDAVTAIRQVGGLLAALRRPANGDLSVYKDRLEIGEEPLQGAETNRSVSELIVLAYYGWPERRSAVLTADFAAAETALLSIWQQQWSKLRMRSSFATRPRLGAPDGVDIQVAAIRGRGAAKPDVLLEASAPPATIPDWVGLIAGDQHGDETDLQRFLHRFGPDAPRGRVDVPALARVQDLLKVTATGQVFQTLAGFYPEPTDMRTLKRVLIATDEVWNAPDRLRLVSALHHATAVDWTELYIGRQIADLLRGDRSGAAEVLVLVHQAPLPQRIIEEAFWSVASETTSAVIAEVARRDVGTAASLSEVAPGALVHKSLWADHEAWQRPLLESLVVTEPVRGLAESLLEAQRDDLLEVAASQGLVGLGDVLAGISAEGATIEVLDRILAVTEGDPTELWRRAELKTAPWNLRLLALAVPGLGASTLARLYGSQAAAQLGEADDQIRVRVASRLLLDALTRGPGAKPVIETTFPIVHRALVDARMPEATWADIDRALPWPGSWDRAERLRKALVDSIKRQRWSRAEIAQIIRDSGPEAGRIRDLADDRSDLERFFDGVWKKLSFWD